MCVSVPVCTCMYVFLIKGDVVGGKEGGGEKKKERVLYSTHINHVEEK